MEEKVYFKTSDGLKLCGILSKNENSKDKCIVLCHGLSVDKNESDDVFVKLSNSLNNTGFSVFRFDFRGHGESDGEQTQTTIKGEEKDLETAIKFLWEKGFSQFGLLGASFAGGPVCYFSAKTQSNIKAIVFWNSLLDYDSIINPKTDWQKKYWGKDAFERVKKYGFTEVASRKFKVGKGLIEEMKVLKPWEKLKDLDMPILFIHGEKDTYIDCKDSIRFSKMTKNGRVEIIKDAEHGLGEIEKHFNLAAKSVVDFFLENV